MLFILRFPPRGRQLPCRQPAAEPAHRAPVLCILPRVHAVLLAARGRRCRHVPVPDVHEHLHECRSAAGHGSDAAVFLIRRHLGAHDEAGVDERCVDLVGTNLELGLFLGGLQACLDEAGDNLAALRHAVEQQQLPQVAWLAEHLAAQLEAIAREASAWSLREWDSAPPKIARWQRKRIQHQDFERRLREMVAERRARLARVTDLVEQQTLHREVEAYEARLARCRHALEKIENRLARLTR